MHQPWTSWYKFNRRVSHNAWLYDIAIILLSRYGRRMAWASEVRAEKLCGGVIKNHIIIQYYCALVSWAVMVSTWVGRVLHLPVRVESNYSFTVYENKQHCNHQGLSTEIRNWVGHGLYRLRYTVVSNSVDIIRIQNMVQ